MRRLSNATRISIGLTLVTLSVIGAAYALGLMPNRGALENERRLRLSQSMAVQFSVALEQDEPEEMLRLAESMLAYTPDIDSLAIRRDDASLLFASAGHDDAWAADHAGGVTGQKVAVPLYDDRNERWGGLEVVFAPGTSSWLTRWGLPVFVAGGCLLAFMLYMRRTLRALDPSQVVPERVKAALDTLTEGALVIDLDDQIMLANQAMAEMLEREPEEMFGKKASGLQWCHPEHDRAADRLPWDQASADGVCRGEPIRLRTPSGMRTLVVNATPILGAGSQARGALVTFDDVTSIEEKNRQLVDMVRQLGEAQEHVQRQNKELHRLATRDALTGCLNRRAFHEQLDLLAEMARRHDEPFTVLMLDIDHFKSINDEHGHAVGDDVLRAVGKLLAETVRKCDVVCRYGGEEFCVLMPVTAIEGGVKVGQKLLGALSTRRIAGLKVTASIGVAALNADESPEVLVDRADEALYCAKRTGRDRVIRYDQRPDMPAEDRGRPEPADPGQHIPIHAVSALFAALRYRDPQTAEHGRRVADLCVRFAAGRLGARDLFVLEVAATLHDIGKVGVPDDILLKPGPLTDEEWRVMRAHDRIGIEILECFDCRDVVEIVRNHHAHFGDPDRRPHLPTGQAIPEQARILSIADAYDAMVTERVYRPALRREEAFAELRRCAGSQFDPQLVEAFIQMELNDDGRVAAQSDLEHELRLGLEIERLAGALMRRDLESIGALSDRLEGTANTLGRDEVAKLARQLSQSAEDGTGLQEVMAQVHELLRQCHSSRRSAETETRESAKDAA